MQTKPLPLAIPVGWLVLAAAFWFLLLAPARQDLRRPRDGSHLRHVWQASVVYAADHQDRLPVAVDVWSYAAELARGGGLNEASVWLVDHVRRRLDSPRDRKPC